MPKIVITGASGFVGRQCVPLLLARGYEIHAIGRTQQHPPEWESVLWHEADLLQPGAPTRLILDLRAEYLLHLAWSPAVPGQFWNAPDNLGWARASLELFEAFARSGGRRVVATGSCAEYGQVTGECDETTTRLNPTTLYGICKHAVQTVASAWCEKANLSFAWARLFYLFGPYENPMRVIPYVTRSLLKQEPALCSSGRQELDYLYIKDAASALVSLLESSVEGAVNIGSGKPISLRHLLEGLGKTLGHPHLIRFGERSSPETAESFWANTARLRNEVGWNPQYDLDSAIRETIAWWQQQDHLAKI
ncbi:MAG TPA: NAD(P)-dependent oxidoreductase [Terriglobales bacterium]|nr:NAD(P)-dependent oxidoreductase [Terriglobales bacterium]